MGAGNYIQHWCAWYRAGVGCDARLAVILVTWLGCCPVINKRLHVMLRDLSADREEVVEFDDVNFLSSSLE